MDEDSPFLLPRVCVTAAVSVTQAGVTDPNLGNNAIAPATCETFILKRPFTPTFDVVQDDIEGPSDPLTPPVDNDCALASPCELKIDFSVPGGQPLPDYAAIIPGNGTPTGAYYLTRGDSDPLNGTIPNGVRVARSSFFLNLKISPGPGPCNVPVPSPAFNLFDGALPAAFGEGSDDPSKPALANPNVWPTRLEASPMFQAFNLGAAGGYAGAQVWARATALAPVSHIAFNIVVFRLPTGWAQVFILGDPSEGLNYANSRCAPVAFSTTYLGETGSDDVLPGRNLRVCNQPRAGATPADFHQIIGRFIRNDIGETVNLSEGVTCTGGDYCPVSSPDPVDANGCADRQVDADGDGICDPGALSGGPSGCTGSDNCPNVPNPGQEDTDGDGIGDACESQPPIAVGGPAGIVRPPSTGGEAFPWPVALLAVAVSIAIAGALLRLHRRRTR